MSTFFASFLDLTAAKHAVDELLASGISPDSLSIIANANNVRSEERSEPMWEDVRSVGDATVLVGRSDDPPSEGFPLAADDPFSRYTSAELVDSTMGIDTSRIESDVESVDQSDDSQEAANRMIYPPREVSQSEHERDDLNLAVLTGFPTAVPLLDPMPDGTVSQDQNDGGLDSLEIPGAGVMIGGGALATAALSFVQPEGGSSDADLLNFLVDEGVDRERANDLLEAFIRGESLMAVEVVPGIANEDEVEAIASRYGAQRGHLVDAPRFYQDGGTMPRSGGAES